MFGMEVEADSEEGSPPPPLPRSRPPPFVPSPPHINKTSDSEDMELSPPKKPSLKPSDKTTAVDLKENLSPLQAGNDWLQPKTVSLLNGEQLKGETRANGHTEKNASSYDNRLDKTDTNCEAENALETPESREDSNDMELCGSIEESQYFAAAMPCADALSAALAVGCIDESVLTAIKSISNSSRGQSDGDQIETPALESGETPTFSTRLGRTVKPVDHFNVSSTSLNDYKSPSLKRSSSQRTSAIPMESQSGSALGYTQLFREGDVVWSHLSGYPWWPAMISKLEAETGVFQVRAGNKVAQYSVVFFDDGRHTWLHERDLSIYEGVEAFEKLRKDKLDKKTFKNAGEKHSITRRWMTVSAAMKPHFDRAVALAEEVLQLTYTDRIQRLKRCKGRLQIISLEELEELERKPPTPQKSKGKSSVKRSASQSVDKSGESRKKRRLSHISTHGTTNTPKKKSAISKFADKSRKKMSKPKLEEKDVDNSDDDTDINNELAFTNLLFSEPVCFGCELRIESGEIRKCSGFCKRTFHVECVTSSQMKPFLCGLCAAGTKWCFSCENVNENGEETIPCGGGKCWRSYHRSCVERRKVADKTPSPIRQQRSYVCAMHTCHNCLARDRTQKAKRGIMIKCIKCPTAYHRTEVCVPAGAVLLNREYLVCPDHFNGKEAANAITHVNVDYCFECGKGGKLVCCETCPLAYHEGCLSEEVTEEEAWTCCFCLCGIHPMYDDLVWAKLGHYRWWPGKVLHPRDIPTRIQEKPHSAGEFCVRFLGSGDCAYLTRGRVFLFDEKDSDSKAKKGEHTKSVAKQYIRGLKEAEEELKAKKQRNKVREEAKVLKSGNRGPFYNNPDFKIIKGNRVKDKVLVSRFDEDEDVECYCSPDAEDPCGSEKTCSNRAMQIECNPSKCPAKHKCQNQRFQKRQYAQTVAYATSSKGWGLRAGVLIPEGTFIIEYTGDVISQSVFRERWKKKSVQSDENFYFLSLDKHRVIDAGPAGNEARFINHSCDPNCTTLTWTVANDIRIGIFATKDIQPGEELTFHYNFDSLDATMKLPCHCGGKSCEGFIGKEQMRKSIGPGAFANGNGTDSTKKSAQKKKKRKWDNECFLCREGGELMCCERSKCSKVYHMSCVDVDEISRKEEWYCPWHYCNQCQKASDTKRCYRCTNSYCKQHGTEADIEKMTRGGLWICNECKEQVGSLERAHSSPSSKIFKQSKTPTKIGKGRTITRDKYRSSKKKAHRTDAGKPTSLDQNVNGSARKHACDKESQGKVEHERNQGEIVYDGNQEEMKHADETKSEEAEMEQDKPNGPPPQALIRRKSRRTSQQEQPDEALDTLSSCKNKDEKESEEQPQTIFAKVVETCTTNSTSNAGIIV